MFDPQNALERALVAAATDPAARPQFYRELVAANLFVIQEGPPPASPRAFTAEAGFELKIRHVELRGRSWMPVFSSLPRLQAFLDHEAGYLGMNALELMKITRGASLLLNAASEYGKELLPEEIESILDGSIWRPRSPHVLERDTKVLLGQPSRPPQELVAVLRRVFARHKDVKKAYLAHFVNPSEDGKPHTLIAIEASANHDRIVSEAMLAANAITVPDPPVDFTLLPNPGFDSYFRSVRPFYRRKRFGLF
ncbi:MAG TPA: enhanced serine sensitivity protein SseB C-terminal domain-containing protein [Thermoanaerobaculia bacterium]|nr:enhanced serine sensitivity protein SseB C-terminal domain-containing protein [Thermoanaerobaculia bacterium]